MNLVSLNTIYTVNNKPSFFEVLLEKSSVNCYSTLFMHKQDLKCLMQNRDYCFDFKFDYEDKLNAVPTLGLTPLPSYMRSLKSGTKMESKSSITLFDVFLLILKCNGDYIDERLLESDEYTIINDNYVYAFNNVKMGECDFTVSMPANRYGNCGKKLLYMRSDFLLNDTFVFSVGIKYESVLDKFGLKKLGHRNINTKDVVLYRVPQSYNLCKYDCIKFSPGHIITHLYNYKCYENAIVSLNKALALGKIIFKESEDDFIDTGLKASSSFNVEKCKLAYNLEPEFKSKEMLVKELVHSFKKFYPFLRKGDMSLKDVLANYSNLDKSEYVMYSLFYSVIMSGPSYEDWREVYFQTINKVKKLMCIEYLYIISSRCEAFLNRYKFGSEDRKSYFQGSLTGYCLDIYVNYGGKNV